MCHMRRRLDTCAREFFEDRARLSGCRFSRGPNTCLKLCPANGKKAKVTIMGEERMAELEEATIIGLSQKSVNHADAVVPSPTPSVSEKDRDRALACLRYLLEYIGEDPNREGLVDTPDRVLRAWDAQFSGYHEDPEDVLGRTFEEVGGYEDMVLLKGVDFDSHCEHHMIPIQGVAHIAYIPSKRVVGLSKLARLVDIFANRLQTQETFTAQIADTIEKVLEPKGIAVLIEASHKCMVTRGVRKQRARTVTTIFRGKFEDNPNLESRFLRLIEN